MSHRRLPYLGGLTVSKNAISLSPQCADILSNLRVGPRTTLELQRATGVMAMGPRIHELRVALESQGMVIETRLIEVKNRHRQRCHVAEYTLRRKPRACAKGRAAKRTTAARRA